MYRYIYEVDLPWRKWRDLVVVVVPVQVALD